MSLELTGRVAIVTGAAQGIGEATARKLAGLGAQVVGLDIKADQLQTVMSSIPGGLAIPLDVTDVEADNRAVREVHQRFGHIDILVNAAGGTIGVPGGIDELTVEGWHRVVAVNLHAPFYLSLAVAPIMREQRWGRIITVGSGAGRSHSRTHVLPYAAAKAGVHGLMRQFAVELAPYGVTCNAVAPGLIMSPLGLEGWARRTEEEKRETLDSIAANRLGEPIDIANTIAFIASEEAGYIVGQTILVDGGHWMF